MEPQPIEEKFALKLEGKSSIIHLTSCIEFKEKTDHGKPNINWIYPFDTFEDAYNHGSNLKGRSYPKTCAKCARPRTMSGSTVVIKESRILNKDVKDVKIQCFNWLKIHQCNIKERQTGKFVAEQIHSLDVGNNRLLDPKKITITFVGDAEYTNVELVFETVKKWQTEWDPSGYKKWWVDVAVDFWYKLDVKLTDEYLRELYPYEDLVIRFNDRVSGWKIVLAISLCNYILMTIFSGFKGFLWNTYIIIFALLLQHTFPFKEVDLFMLKNRLYPEFKKNDIGFLKKIFYKMAFMDTIKIKCS